MKKYLALGFAAVFAATSVGATATAAADWDGGKHWEKQAKYHAFHRRHHDDSFVGPFVFGTLFGFGLSQAFEPYPRSYVVYAGNPHVRWCLRNYPNTYNPATNTYHPVAGVTAVCISPFNGGLY